MRSRSIGLWFVLMAVSTLGLAEEKPPEDQVSFQVEVSREVANDRAEAVLSVTVEQRDPAQLAQQINATMGWALAQLKQHDAIRAHSGGYQTFPVYEDSRIARWRGRQELRLESADVEALSRALGVLQERLQIQSLQFSVSAEQRRQVEAALIEQALAAFGERAQLIRKSLDAQAYRLMDATVHSGPLQQPIGLRAEAMGAVGAAAITSPGFDQGTSRISVQVSGRIQLLRD